MRGVERSLPPSATLSVAVKLTVVALMVSVIAVVAASALIASASKLPPLARVDGRRHVAGVDVHVVAGRGHDWPSRSLRRPRW